MIFALFTMYNICEYVFQIILIVTVYSFLNNECVTYCKIIHLYSWINTYIISYKFPFVVHREVNFELYLTFNICSWPWTEMLTSEMDSTYPSTPKRGITHDSKTNGSKVFLYLTSGHLWFMQITRVTHSCSLRSKAEFILEPESKSTETFTV